jgi:hypothetical protein
MNVLLIFVCALFCVLMVFKIVWIAQDIYWIGIYGPKYRKELDDLRTAYASRPDDATPTDIYGVLAGITGPNGRSGNDVALLGLKEFKARNAELEPMMEFASLFSIQMLTTFVSLPAGIGGAVVVDDDDVDVVEVVVVDTDAVVVVVVATIVEEAGLRTTLSS